LKKFNVTGVCIPEEHYMVNTQEKQARIMSLIQDGKYFTINRARQFGKTTMLMQLNRQLNSIPEYTCIRLTFDFRKNENKERKEEWISVDGKQIFEVII